MAELTFIEKPKKDEPMVETKDGTIPESKFTKQPRETGTSIYQDQTTTGKFKRQAKKFIKKEAEELKQAASTAKRVGIAKGKQVKQYAVTKTKERVALGEKQIPITLQSELKTAFGSLRRTSIREQTRPSTAVRQMLFREKSGMTLTAQARKLKPKKRVTTGNTIRNALRTQRKGSIISQALKQSNKRKSVFSSLKGKGGGLKSILKRF